MTIEHKDMPEAGLHEPKGVSTASSGQVYVGDGAGSGAWKDPELTGQGAATSGDLAFSNGAGSVSWAEGRVGGSLILVAPDFTDQFPSATDTALQNTYGGAMSTTEFDLAADGTLTCNVSGWYKFLWNLRFGRTSSTASAHIIWRVVFNGNQIGKTITASLSGAEDVYPFSLAASLPLTAGDTLVTQVVRDSVGNNDGGLKAFTPTLGSWEKSASASLRIDKEVVVV